MPQTPITEPSSFTYTVRRVQRHIGWIRTEGLRRIIEEDQLDPRKRLAIARRKAAWRREHGVTPGTAIAVYVVGLQRSGTNMLMRGFDEAPEVEVRNENDQKVFYRFRLRADEVLRATVRASRHQFVIVKPLCESHRVAELLDLPGLTGARAVWCYRDVDDRARSEISKFGDSNLAAIRVIAAGEGATIWQGQGLSDDVVATIAGFDVESMTADTAAALFWWARNRLYFDLELDARPDILLSSYDELVRDPEAAMRALCEHLRFDYRPELHAHIEVRSSHESRPLTIDPAVRALCDELGARLDQARTAPTSKDTA